MKLKVVKPESVIWSAETREVTLNDGERDITIRYYEGWEGSETHIRINDGDLLEYYDVDEYLQELVTKVTSVFKADFFNNVGEEIDVEELDEF